MRKVFWCCVAAGATVCCAFGTAAYVVQNPDSLLGRTALAVCPVGPHHGTAATALPGQPATAETDDLVPADPVPVDDPPPLPPTPGSHVPPEVAALMTPPIIIHDEEDLNPQTGPSAADHGYADAVRPASVEVGDLARRLDGDGEPQPPAGPPVMPYCAESDGPAPAMPYCTEGDSAAAGAPAAGPAPYREFDACAFWMGFFSGPSHMFSDRACTRCEEDVHYPQQYSGVPYTGETGASSPQPPAVNLKPTPTPPAVEEQSEPPAPKEEVNSVAPRSHLKHAQPGDPQSDTMEMRPSDWKPYSLAPGPF